MPQTYSTSIELRFSDLDAYGHVNSAVYFTYLETARVKLFNDFFREVSQHGIFTLVARAECEFKIPITLYDEVIVTLWMSKTGRSSFDLEYRIHDGNEKTYATARTTMVCFDSIKNKTVAIPESIKAMA
ncbi:MAG: thioesterase family protein [Desulfuromonadaceae bacterium]|nr:thioesterase family protein [Desulfuromonadaceae bacterium]